MANDLLGKLGEAFVLLRADGSTLNADMKKEKKELEKELASWEGSFKKIGKGLSVSVTPAILAMGAAAVAAGVQIDDALDTIRIKTGATGQAAAGLEESFKKVFVNVPASAQEVADALSAIHQRTGLTGQGLEDLTQKTLTLARITKTDLNTVIEASQDLFANWGVSAEQQGDKLDFLFNVAQKTGVGVDKLMQSLTASGAVLREFGLSIEESAALLGQMEKNGIDADAMLAGLRKAAANFAKDGIELKVGLQGTVEQIKALGPGLQATQLALDVFGNKVGTQVADAIHKGKFSVNEFIKEIERAPDSINGAAEATDGFAEKLQTFRNKATLALEPLGTKLLDIGLKAMPVLEGIANVAIKAADAFSELPAPVQNIAIGLGAAAAAAGPVIYAIGTMIGSVTTIVGLFGKWAPAIAGTTAALTALGVAVAGISLYKIVEAGSLLRDLHNQQKQASKDLVEETRMGQQAIAILLDKTGVKARSAAEAYVLLQAHSKGLRGETIDLSHASDQLKQAWETGIAAGKKLRDETTKNADASKKAAAAAATEAERQKKAAEAKAAAAAATKAYNEELQRLNDQFSGKGLLDNANKYLLVLKQIGGASRLTKDESGQMNKVFSDALDKLKALGKVGTAEWNNIADAWMDTLRIGVVDGLSGLEDDIAKLPKVVIVPPFTFDMPKVVSGISAEMAAEFAKTAIPITFKGASLAEQLFGGLGTAEFGKKLTGNIIGAIQSGGGAKAIGSTIGATIGQEVGTQGGKIIGSLATKAVTAVAGKAIGSAIGAAAGSVIPVVGTLLGGMVGGWLGGLFGGGEKKKVQEAREELIKNAGGLDELKKKADIAGVSIDKLLSTKKMKDFNAEVEKLNKAFGDYDKRVKGVATALAGVNTLAQGFAMQTEKQTVATEQNAASWERLGKFTLATFAEQVRISGDIIGTLQQMQPAFDVLLETQKKFGFEGSESTQKLLDMYKAVKDNNDVFTSLSGIGAIMRGLGDAMVVNKDLALAFGQELAAQFQILTDRGVDTTMALALMQPQLQQLWELQKDGKLVTDEATQALLDQAEAQGIVGAQMKDVNEKILDVLLAIGEALGATIPESARKFAAAVGGIEVPPIDVEVRYRETGRPEAIPEGGGEPLPEFGKGGIGNFGMGSLAVLHGPEAVIPLDRLESMMASSQAGMDPKAFADAMVAAGIKGGDVVLAPTFNGTLANEMRGFLREELIPMMISVLQDSGELRSRMTVVTTPSATGD